MEAVIEFNYFDYAQIDDHAFFTLKIYNEAGEEVLSQSLGKVDIPKDIIEYIGDEDIKWNGVSAALCKATIKLNHYWEE